MADVLTIVEVRKWLAENKDTEEVRGFFKELIPEKTVTVDQVSAFLATEEGTKLLESQTDARVTSAVKKRDKYHEDRLQAELKKQLAAEILKLNPEEPPEQKQIRELRKQFEESEKAREVEKLQTRIATKAHEMDVDPLFVAEMKFENEDEAVVWMKRVKDRDKLLKDKISNEILASGYKPGGGQDHNGKPKVDLKGLTREQMIKMEMEGKLDEAISTNR